MNVTVLIGNNPSATNAEFLYGFEASDFTIDLEIPGSHTDASLGGIEVTGANIYLRRILVKGFGNKGFGPFGYALCAANLRASLPLAENCVIDSCRVETSEFTLVNSNGFAGIYLGATGATDLHRFCVVRNNYINLSAAGTTGLTQYRAIVVEAGYGTIVEHNRVANALVGISSRPGTDPRSSADLIFRHNIFYNVAFGIYQDFGGASGKSIGRIIILNNIIEWPGPGTFTEPVGILLKNEGYPSTFQKVLIRDNLMRNPDSIITSPPIGISLNDWVDAIVDNNISLVQTANNAFQHSNSSKVKVFNNLLYDGTFTPGYNVTDATHDQELTTDVEDVLLGI